MNGSRIALFLLGAFGWAASLVVPHPVEPTVVPAPRVDFAQLRVEQAREAARAQAAESTPLPFEVRVVGELVRRLGVTEYAGNAQESEALQHDMRRAVRAVADPERLLDLRALQTRRFIDACAGLPAPPSRELVELGGSFAKHVDARALWQSPRLRPDADELAALYHIRWNELTGLGQDLRFRPSANERRLDYRQRLRSHQLLAVPDRGRAELHTIEALSRFDPDYPTGYARGIALIHAGAHQAAFDVLQEYVAGARHGEYVLRARNFALYAARELGN